MKPLKRLLARIRNLVSHQSGDQRFLEEMGEHLSRQTEENLRSGMTPAEARRQAVLKFGGVEAIREQYHAEKSLPFMESVVQDVRYSTRILGKSWGFTSVAAISLALAIGANTTIFSVIKRLLLDRLDVPHAEQLRLLHWYGDRHTVVTNMWGMSDNMPEGIGAASFSYPAFEQLRRDNHVLEDLFAFKDVGRMNATIDGNAQILQGELVSGNFFDQLQVQPQLGRPILAGDDRIGAPTVALISAELWQRAFGSSPAVVGRTIKVNLVPVEIVGVAPSEFTGAKGPRNNKLPLIGLTPTSRATQ
jgi:MacB-like periplasmic core domain